MGSGDRVTSSSEVETLDGSDIRDLPDALGNREELARRLAGKRPAVFLDYDGTLTPIVDRPEDAVISAAMRKVVRALAKRCPVCVVSGRDRAVVQELMGIDDLIVAGSHGFDIWSPRGGTVEHRAASGFDGLLSLVRARLSQHLDTIEGIHIESKKRLDRGSFSSCLGAGPAPRQGDGRRAGGGASPRAQGDARQDGL